MTRISAIIALFCVYYVARTDAELTEAPQNSHATANVGETAVLRCVAANSLPAARIIWNEFTASDSGRTVSDNRGIVPSHPNAARYAIIGSDIANEFHLQISNVEIGDGGRYMCQDINSAPPAMFRGYADLVVIESDPVCLDYTLGAGGVVENQIYTGECEIYYRGNLGLRMEWFGMDGSFIQNGTTPPGSVWAIMRFIAHRTLHGQLFFCRTTFLPVFNSDPSFASNTPNYTHTYTGPILSVNWPPQNMSHEPFKINYEAGDVLTANVDSSPPATIQWTNQRTLVAAPPGPTFTVTPDLQGTNQSMRINAISLIDGAIYTNDLFIPLNVLAATTTTGTTTTTQPLPNAPCDDLTGRWTATNPAALVCLTVDPRGNIFTLIRNGTDLFFVTGRGKTVVGDYSHVGFTCLWPNAGTAGFTGECHKCFGNEVVLMSGMSRNKHHSESCGTSIGTQLTNLYVFVRSGPACLGMTVDEVRTNQPWILDKMGVKAKKIVPL